MSLLFVYIFSGVAAIDRDVGLRQSIDRVPADAYILQYHKLGYGYEP